MPIERAGELALRRRLEDVRNAALPIAQAALAAGAAWLVAVELLDAEARAAVRDAARHLAAEPPLPPTEPVG